MKSLLESWAALADASVTDPKTPGHVLNILEKTLPTEENAEPLRALESMISERRSPAPTAANPRAYKGTKRKLPKQPGTATNLDLRPYLLSQRSVKEVLSHFEFRCSPKDPYLSANHSDAQISSIYDLPAPFRRFVLPAMRGSAWSSIAGFLKLYWEFDLSNDQRLLARLCRYLKLKGSVDALVFLSEIAKLSSDFRADVLNLLIEMEEGGTALPQSEAGWLLKIFDGSEPGHFLDTVRFFLGYRAQNIPSEYIEIAIDLYRKFEPVMSTPWSNELRVYNDMNEPGLSADEFPVRELHDCLLRQSAHDPDDDLFIEWPRWGLGLLLWKQFARSPELAAVFKTIPWDRLHPAIAQAYALLILHSSNIYGIDDQENERKIEILLAHHNRITEFLLRVGEPEHQKSFLCDIDRLPDAMKELRPEIFSKFLDLLERVSRPPFSSDSYVSTLFYALLAKLPNEYHDKILLLTDSELARLSRSCLRYNETLLVSSGVAELSSCEPHLVVRALSSFHGKLLKVGKLLGSINRKLRTEILLEFQGHALSTLKLPLIRSEELVSSLNLILSSGCGEQIPRKLRGYIAGEIDLTDAQLARSVAVAASKLYLVKLDFLER
ncbi:MAG TPA: hypothetical protein V6C72_14550, partial [Chroococcales cyanobacterium]